MSTFFDSLPNGMTARVAPPVCYIRDVPHSLIDVFETLIGYGWREVMYINMDYVSENTHDAIWLSLPEIVRDMVQAAKEVECETLALHPRIVIGRYVYLDENNNVRLLRATTEWEYIEEIGISDHVGEFTYMVGKVTLPNGEKIEASRANRVPRVHPPRQRARTIQDW